MENGKLGKRLSDFELPELASIGKKFNGMAEKLELSINRNLGLSRHIISLEEVERKNLARDLHDEIGQSIKAIHVDAQAILGVTKNMMGITHQILDRLRPDAIDKLGLKTALADLASTWKSKLGGADCTLNISGDLEGLTETISITAYRIVQESLTNIARYANAKKVYISILQEENTLVLMVEDDGDGFDLLNKTDGYGLTGMRERVEGLGGEFELDSAIDEGTCLVIRLPLSA